MKKKKEGAYAYGIHVAAEYMELIVSKLFRKSAQS